MAAPCTSPCARAPSICVSCFFSFGCRVYRLYSFRYIPTKTAKSQRAKADAKTSPRRHPRSCHRSPLALLASCSSIFDISI